MNCQSHIIKALCWKCSSHGVHWNNTCNAMGTVVSQPIPRWWYTPMYCIGFEVTNVKTIRGFETVVHCVFCVWFTKRGGTRHIQSNESGFTWHGSNLARAPFYQSIWSYQIVAVINAKPLTIFSFAHVMVLVLCTCVILHAVPIFIMRFESAQHHCHCEWQRNCQYWEWRHSVVCAWVWHV